MCTPTSTSCRPPPAAPAPAPAAPAAPLPSLPGPSQRTLRASSTSVHPGGSMLQCGWQARQGGCRACCWSLPFPSNMRNKPATPLHGQVDCNQAVVRFACLHTRYSGPRRSRRAASSAGGMTYSAAEATGGSSRSAPSLQAWQVDMGEACWWEPHKGWSMQWEGNMCRRHASQPYTVACTHMPHLKGCQCTPLLTSTPSVSLLRAGDRQG